MQTIISVYKPVGLTPLETIQKLQSQEHDLLNQKITYAGRLDPLAHGVLLLLVGEKTKEKEDYLSLKKTYEFTVVFGIETDTYDLLGLVKDMEIKPPPENVNLIVNTFVNNSLGKKLHRYPPYSSKTVKGKPLFWWARNNKLEEIKIPTHSLEIYAMECLEIEKVSLSVLQKKVKQSVNSVRGDFRQEEILSRWKEFFTKPNNRQSLQKAKFTISCSSGTYIRELIHQLGEEVSCKAVAFDIERTAVGDYNANGALKLS